MIYSVVNLEGKVCPACKECSHFSVRRRFSRKSFDTALKCVSCGERFIYSELEDKNVFLSMVEKIFSLFNN